MNMIEINASALLAACNALLGEEKTKIMNDVYTLVDAAEKRGYAEGVKHEMLQADAADDTARFDADEAYLEGKSYGFDEGFDAGYSAGFDIGYDEAHMDNGYSDGYAQARKDLGECPMVDQDFDVALDDDYTD